jgi:hypothetical protein
MFGQPTPGNRETLTPYPVSMNLECKAFYQAFLNDAKKILVQELRTYFQKNPRTSEYRWVGQIVRSTEEETDFSASKIHVAVERPDHPRWYPAVMIKHVGGRVRDLFLGQRGGTIYAENPKYNEVTEATINARGETYKEPEYLEIGEQLTGKIELTVTLSVKAHTQPELDIITDLLLHGLVGPVRRAVQKQALIWMPDTGNISEEGVEDISQDQKIYYRDVSFSLLTEWWDNFFYNDITIEDFVIERTYLDPTPL